MPPHGMPPHCGPRHGPFGLGGFGGPCGPVPAPFENAPRGCRAGAGRQQNFKNTLFESFSEVAGIFANEVGNKGYDEAAAMARAIKESLQESLKPVASQVKQVVAETLQRVPTPVAKAVPEEKVSAPVAPEAPASKQPSWTVQDEKEDWERVDAQSSNPKATDPMVKWASALSVLDTIGLNDDIEKNLSLLEEENGDLERVVARIISLRA